MFPSLSPLRHPQSQGPHFPHGFWDGSSFKELYSLGLAPAPFNAFWFLHDLLDSPLSESEPVSFCSESSNGHFFTRSPTPILTLTAFLWPSNARANQKNQITLPLFLVFLPLSFLSNVQERLPSPNQPCWDFFSFLQVLCYI